MSARPQDTCAMAEWLHRLALIRSNIATGRPAVAAADGWIDDCLASIDSAVDFLENAQRIVQATLRHADQREAGDRDSDDSPREWPRYPWRHAPNGWPG